MIHHVFATKSNIGDWLSALGIQSLIKPHKVIEHFCDRPFVKETLNHLSSTGPDDIIIIGGGGLFMDYFEPFWKGFDKSSDRTPYCLWGVGLCDLKNSTSCLSETLLSSIITKSFLTAVRDELTYHYLHNGITCKIVPCPAMSIIEPPQYESYGLLYADHYDVVGPDGYMRINTILNKYALETGRNFRETDNQIPDGDDQSLLKTLDLYAKSDIVVSSRLHGCIIGIAMGRKVIAISGDKKVESFMNSAGLNDWVIDIKDIKYLDQLLNLLSTQRTPWEFINRVKHDNRVVAEKIIAYLKV